LEYPTKAPKIPEGSVKGSSLLRKKNKYINENLKQEKGKP